MGKARRRGFYRDAAAAFHGKGVEQGYVLAGGREAARVGVPAAAVPAGGSGVDVLVEAGGEGRLSVVDVRDDAEVSDEGRIEGGEGPAQGVAGERGGPVAVVVFSVGLDRTAFSSSESASETPE